VRVAARNNFTTLLVFSPVCGPQTNQTPAQSGEIISCRDPKAKKAATRFVTGDILLKLYNQALLFGPGKTLGQRTSCISLECEPEH
jgi:hypothetical protein